MSPAGKRIESPSCTSFKSVIVFMERNQLFSRMPLHGVKTQEIEGILATLISNFIASFPCQNQRKCDRFFFDFEKNLSQLWTQRTPMNCTTSFSIGKVKMSCQTCYLFRDSVFHHRFVDGDKIFGMVVHQIRSCSRL